MTAVQAVAFCQTYYFMLLSLTSRRSQPGCGAAMPLTDRIVILLVSALHRLFTSSHYT